MDSRIKRVVRFQTTDGKTHASLAGAERHQERLDQTELANELLEKGLSIGQILKQVCNQDPNTIPEILFKVSKDSKLVIEHWQCRNNPGYQPMHFNLDGSLHVWGHAGSWSGPYGNDVSISELIRYASDDRSDLAEGGNLL